MKEKEKNLKTKKSSEESAVIGVLRRETEGCKKQHQSLLSTPQIKTSPSPHPNSNASPSSQSPTQPPSQPASQTSRGVEVESRAHNPFSSRPLSCVL
ncbi:hypothetical protein E2C01_094424 [Portunus trituberculatus]|uniref:Uncharacterized protein n=1 Tax=Portunus trituberculatus TaxID=210409 RepID=A0A5B7JQD9_PORTR|nr:hypothetical protein [Portunus trituberculatus]